MQWQVDHLQPGRPVAQHQRQVGLAGLAAAKLFLQGLQRAALLGDQQHAAGFTVEPVHQFQQACLRPRLAQLLDHAEAHARAAVHRHAGGLVDGDQVLVFQQHREFARRRRALRPGHHPLGQAHRGHAHLVTGGQPGVGRRAAPVHPHLTAADDAVDVRLGHALEVAQEEVVQPLAGAFLVHRQARDRGLIRSRHGHDFDTYNAPCWQTAVSG